VQPDFSLEGEGQAVVEICQLVDGVPLAIELAASWTRMLTCKEIAAEIRNNLDFLETNLRNTPDRHRSMRAVFDQSWRFLSVEEQEIFKRLSVFRGGFDGEAAESVANASLMTLALFTDKSLLQCQPNSRYEIHELLRQYAAERLEKSSDDVCAIRDLHCTYYADYLAQRVENIMGGQQLQAAAEIELELDNIHLAWQWAIETARIDVLAAAAPALAMFYQIRSRYLVGAQMFEKAVRALGTLDRTSAVDLALVTLLVEQAWFYIRLGRLEQAEAALIQCEESYRRLDIPPIPGLATDPSLGLSALAAIRGDYPAARQLAEQALEQSLLHNHLQNQQVANYFAVQPTLALGDDQRAHQYALKAYQRAQETQDRWSMSYYLNELGDVARALGKDAEAQQHYQLSYTLREEFDDAEGMALALNRLGDLAAKKGAFSEAEQIYTQSRSIYEEIGDKGGLATSFQGLGVAFSGQGKYALAREYFWQALQTAQEIQFIPRVLSIFLSVAELFLETGRSERGLELLALIEHHPAVDHETKEPVQLLLDQYRTQASGDQLKAAIQFGQDLDLETTIEAILVELASNVTDTKLNSETLTSVPLKETQSLVDPLTPRELEVLGLIAAGLTNRGIAEELVIAVGTVKRYTAEIYRKLDVHSRTQAVARARELDILT
jgi:DNA-binding NarL/FixJ family response regulator